MNVFHFLSFVFFFFRKSSWIYCWVFWRMHIYLIYHQTQIDCNRAFLLRANFGPEKSKYSTFVGYYEYLCPRMRNTRNGFSSFFGKPYAHIWYQWTKCTWEYIFVLKTSASSMAVICNENSALNEKNFEFCQTKITLKQYTSDGKQMICVWHKQICNNIRRPVEMLSNSNVSTKTTLFNT